MKDKSLIVVLVLICIIVIISLNKASREHYPKQGVKHPAGTLISEKQVENIKYKFKMVKVETFFESGIDSLVPGEEERTNTFNSGAARVYIGYSSKGENIKLVIDPNNDKNLEDTAFIVYLD